MRDFKIVATKEVEKVLNPTFWQKILPWKQPKKQLSPQRFEIYCGPLKKTDLKLHDLLPGMDANELPSDMKKIVEDKWTPTPELTVYDPKSKSALTASQALEYRKNNRWMPTYFQNPMQSYDYIVYESYNNARVFYKKCIINYWLEEGGVIRGHKKAHAG